MWERDLAEKSGVAAATINRLELGRRGAYPVTVRRLARALGVEPKALYEPPQSAGNAEGGA